MIVEVGDDDDDDNVDGSCCCCGIGSCFGIDLYDDGAGAGAGSNIVCSKSVTWSSLSSLFILGVLFLVRACGWTFKESQWERCVTTDDDDDDDDDDDVVVVVGFIVIVTDNNDIEIL